MARSDPSLLQPLLDQLLRRTALPSEERFALLGLPATELEFPARHDIATMGAEQPFGYSILSGVVATFVQNSHGQRESTALSFKGDLPNVDSLVCPVAPFGLTALSAVTVVAIAFEALRSAVDRHPLLAEALWRESAARSADLARWSSILARRSARARVCNLLCQIAMKLGSSGAPALDFELPLAQDQIGEATGLTAVHVNRVLMRLRLQGVVNFRSRRVRIQQWDLLAKDGEFSPARV